MNAGIVQDIAGNDFAGLSAGGFNFTTTSDATAPVLVSSSPIDNDTEVSRTANIILNFSEAVTTGAGNIQIIRSVDDQVVETITADSGNISGRGTTTLTINPSNDLPFAEDVYILIDSNAIMDLSANEDAGISLATALSFRTFSPLDINGVVLWLDGQDVNANVSNPANGSPVSLWRDKGPNNTDITGTGTGTVTYNTASEGVEFANTLQPFDDNYDRTGPNNTLSIFTVSTIGNSNLSIIMESRDPRIAIARETISGGATDLSDNVAWPGGPLSGRQMASVEYRSDRSSRAYENATEVLSFSNDHITLSANPRITLGDDTTGDNRMINGEFIHSILIYNADIASADRERIEGFLAHKWGIEDLLPGSHPYKAVPP